MLISIFIPNDPAKEVPNPESKAQFLKKKILEYVQEVAVGFETTAGAEEGRDKAREKAKRELEVS